MAVLPNIKYSTYVPMTDDINVRNRILNRLRTSTSVPTEVSPSYPERGVQIQLRTKSKLYSCKENAICLEDSPLTTAAKLDDILVVLCSFGSNPDRLVANKKGLELLYQMNPAPKVVFTEGSVDGQWHFEHLKAYKDWSYVPVNLNYPYFHNFFLKESLWNHGANTILDVDKTIKYLVFLDADCFFVDRYGFQSVHDSFQHYDVISPMHSCYYTGSYVEAKKYGLLNTMGYAAANHMTHGAYQGFAFGCTVDFYKTFLHNDLPSASLGLGDTLLWFMLTGRKQMRNSTMLPYRTEECMKYLLPEGIRIGYAENIIGHIDHGEINNRIYKVRSQFMKMSVPIAFREMTRFNNTHIMGWADTPEAKDLRWVYENMLIDNRRDIKINDYESAAQYWNWLHGLCDKPPKSILPNPRAKNNNSMPFEGIAVPVPDKQNTIY